MRLPAEQRREQLLAVAGEVFAAQGFHGPSMDALAEAAGVSKPILYQHFSSKRALYQALVEDAAAELLDRVGKALASTSDNRARVGAAVGAFLDFVEDPRFRLLFVTSDGTDDDVVRVVDGMRSEIARQVARLIADDAGVDEHAADLLATGVRGLALEGARWWLEQDGLPREEATRLLSSLAWRGLSGFTGNPGR